MTHIGSTLLSMALHLQIHCMVWRYLIPHSMCAECRLEAPFLFMGAHFLSM